MGGSFNQVMSSGMHGNMRASQNKTMHHQGVGNQSMSNAGNASGAVTNASGRPVTSYSGKVLGKKKHNNMSDPHHGNVGGVGGGSGSYQQHGVTGSGYGQQRGGSGNIGSGGGPSSQTHVINQSLKPKMIMNNGGSHQGGPNRQGSSHGGH